MFLHAGTVHSGWWVTQQKNVKKSHAMLRRKNRPFSCLYYPGATDSLHYMDSRTAHICNIQWEPCILDQESILSWSVLRNLHTDADPATLILKRTICLGHYKKIIQSLCPKTVWDILESILFWSMLQNLNTDADPVTRILKCMGHYQQIIHSLCPETAWDVYVSDTINK